MGRASQVPVLPSTTVFRSDNCGGAVTVSWQGDSISSSNCPGQFVISRTYRAADQCGNSATCIQSITVNDTNPPSLTCPTGLAVGCASQVAVPDTNSVTTSDNCGGAVTVSWQGDSISSSNCVGQFIISRTYRARAQEGSGGNESRTITVNDTKPPNTTDPTHATVECATQRPKPKPNKGTDRDNEA